MSKPKRSLERAGVFPTTGGAGYIPANYGATLIPFVRKLKNKAANWIRQRLYDKVDPYSYDIGNAVSQFLYKGRSTKKDDVYDALWAKYLNRTNEQVGYDIDSYIQPATYKPSKGTTIGKTYKLTPKAWDNAESMSPLSDRQLYNLLKSGKKAQLVAGDGGPKTGLGTYTVSLGEDEHGKYMSYYDEWDISPIGDKDGKEGKDQTLGIGTPFSIYDRRYYTDDEAKHIMSEYNKFFKSYDEMVKHQDGKHEIYSPKPYKRSLESGGK